MEFQSVEERLAKRVARKIRRNSRPIYVPPARNTPDANLWAMTVAHQWPWKFGCYPGWSVAAGQALNLVPATVLRWKGNGARRIGSKSAGSIAALLESRAATSIHLAQQWREYESLRISEEIANRRVSPFREFAMAEKVGWRSRKRK